MIPLMLLVAVALLLWLLVIFAFANWPVATFVVLLGGTLVVVYAVATAADHDA